MRAVSGETVFIKRGCFGEGVILTPRQPQPIRRQREKPHRELPAARGAHRTEAAVRRGDQIGGHPAIAAQQRSGAVAAHRQAGPVLGRNPIERAAVARIQIALRPRHFIRISGEIGDGVDRHPRAVEFIHPDRRRAVLHVEVLAIRGQTIKRRGVRQRDAGRGRGDEGRGIRLRPHRFHGDGIDHGRPVARATHAFKLQAIGAGGRDRRVGRGKVPPLRLTDDRIRPRGQQRRAQIQAQPVIQAIEPAHGLEADAVGARRQIHVLIKRSAALNKRPLLAVDGRRAKPRGPGGETRSRHHPTGVRGAVIGPRPRGEDGGFEAGIGNRHAAAVGAGGLPAAENRPPPELARARRARIEVDRRRRWRPGARGLRREDIAHVVFQ